MKGHYLPWTWKQMLILQVGINDIHNMNHFTAYMQYTKENAKKLLI